MTPKPYSDKSSFPTDSPIDAISGIPTEVLPETPSPSTVSGATTPSPTPQEQVPVENFVDTVNIQENSRVPDFAGVTPCYPTPGDIMPYDHSLPDFIRQITNEPNLANLHSLSLRVISTLISLHRMSAYLPNLRELDLEGSVLNSLRDIGCSLKNLQILKVGRCQLESLDGTFGLSSLRELYAQKNFINDVSPCSNLPHIRHVDVSGNRIRNISYAGFLSVCRKLKSIVFTGNPATEVSGYRNHVRRILPQVETLDGIPFIDEDNPVEVSEPEIADSYEEGSDSGSEVPDFSSVSPSDSTSNLSKSEDSFLLDKKNKQAKNLANQDQSDADVDHQEAANAAKTDFQAQDEFQILNSNQNQVRKGFLGQTKNNDNRHVNLKQKCASIQKLDKDIENRSKKSSLLLSSSVDEEFYRRQLSEGDGANNASTPSTSASVDANPGSTQAFAFPSPGEESAGAPSGGASSNFSITKEPEEIKHGVMKKTSYLRKISDKDEEETMDQPWGTNKLTTGMPVCGNLTAALRSRKKIQSDVHQNVRTRSTEADGSGEDSGGAAKDDVTGADVLIASRKWRESFHRFRSGNRASREEAGEEDENGEFQMDAHI